MHEESESFIERVGRKIENHPLARKARKLLLNREELTDADRDVPSMRPLRVSMRKDEKLSGRRDIHLPLEKKSDRPSIAALRGQK